MANTPNPIKSQATLYIVGGIVVIAVASIIYLAIARPILQKIGIIDDKKIRKKIMQSKSLIKVNGLPACHTKPISRN